MSVWKHPHYRDEPVQWGLRNIPPAYRNNPFFYSLCDFEVEDPGEFQLPGAIEPGNFKEQVRKDPNVLKDIDCNANYYHSIALGELANTLPAVTTGITAVYRVAAYILNRARTTEIEDEGKENSKFLQKTVDYGFAASSHSQKDAAYRKDAIKQAAEGDWEKANLWIQDLVRLRNYHRTASQRAAVFRASVHREPQPPVPERDAGRFTGFHVYSTRGAIILHPKLGFGGYILTSKDVERVDKIVRGISLSDVYGKLYFALPADQRTRFVRGIERFRGLLVRTMSSVDSSRANQLCEAFDVAFGVYVAQSPAGDDRRAYREQTAKFFERKLHDIVSYNEVLSCIAGMPFKESMEILLMYKALPQPDFDYFAAARRQKDMYEENRAASIQDGAATGRIFSDAMNYHKLLMVRAFFSRHGTCPGRVKEGVNKKAWHNRYPHLDPRIIPPEDSDDIDLGGEFLWKERGTDNLDLVKDKAILPKNVDNIDNQNDVTNLPVTDKNYLMDVITRDTPIDCRTLLGRLARDELDLDVRADDKAEAKKMWQRLFFELGSEARMILSVYEDSITDYAIYVNGYFLGKSDADKIDAMNNITRPVPDGMPYQPLHVSSDIKKFSPYMPDLVHRALDIQWAEAFGLPELTHMHKIFTQGRVHYIKGCIHHVFDKVGVDFEGFAGKKLTMYHCAVMCTAVRRLRKRDVIVGPGRFACLIDDGLLRVDIRVRNYEAHKAAVLAEVELVLAKCGMRISWDKTYTSRYYATFLHEVRYAGRSLTAGMRAVLKMTNRADEPVDSLAADLRMASSTAYGAIAAGAPQVATYVIYIMFCIGAMRKWAKGKKVFREKYAYRMFLPFQYGGLGLESITTLSGSLKGPSIPECLGHIELIGYVFPEIRSPVNAVLSSRMFSPSAMARIQNPGNMMIYGPRLRDDRFVKLVEKSLVTKFRSPVITALVGAVTSNEATFVELALDNGAFIPQPLREIMMDAEKSMVIRKLAKKFLTARSALCVCPTRAFYRISMKNRTEAAAVLRLVQ